MTAITLLFSFFFPQFGFHPRAVPEGHLPPGLAQRTGKNSCWVRFNWKPHHLACIRKSDWISWLRSPEPQLFCFTPRVGDKRSARKSFSPLHNEGPGNTSDSESPSKERFLIDRVYPCSKIDPALNTSIHLWKSIEKKREQISEILRPQDSTGVFRSLILNEKNGSGHLPLLRKLGFVHLASASGIHLYVLGFTVNQTLKWTCEGFKIPLSIGLNLSRLGTFALCSCLWIFSGARFGMLRPAWILIFRQAAKQLGVQWRPGMPLLISLGSELLFTWTIGLFQGQAVGNSNGRWIYALAVGGGMMGVELFRSQRWSQGRWKSFATHSGLAVGSWIFVAIWEAFETGTVALATPILSLITLPLICQFAYPILTVGLLMVLMEKTWLPGQIWVETLTSLGSTTILKLLSWSQFRGNLWILPKEALGWSAFLVLGAWGIQSRSTLPHRFLVFPLAFPLAFLGIFFLRMVPFGWDHAPIPTLAARVEQLDIGQGDASILWPLITHRFTVNRWLFPSAGMIDTGSEHGLSDEHWIRVLAQRQIRKLDWILISHLDEDHYGGIHRLARLVPIQCVIVSLEESQTVKGKKFARFAEMSGLRISHSGGDCIPFPVISLVPPKSPSKQTHRHRSNEFMLALKAPLLGGGFYLAAGDATARDEMRLLSWPKEIPGAIIHPRILKVSHHGSRTSSSSEFLRQLNPTEAWISAGHGNQYGHPSAEVLNTLNTLKIPVRRTDQKGSIQWRAAKGAFFHHR